MGVQAVPGSKKRGALETGRSETLGKEAAGGTGAGQGRAEGVPGHRNGGSVGSWCQGRRVQGGLKVKEEDCRELER